MEFKFEKKIGEKHIDKFSNAFYLNYKSNPKDNYVFDLENVEWISNQALLLLTSLFKNLYLDQIKFRIIFCELNNSDTPSFRRKIVNIVNLWDNWKIYKVVPDDLKWEEYFSFKNSSHSFTLTLLNELRSRFKITTDQNVYNRIRITPFVELQKIENYVDEKIVSNQISPIFKLNEAVTVELSKSKCEHPFLNNTISHIITKELYENFLDHVNTSVFDSGENLAFMSLSLRKYLQNNPQDILNSNFEDEELVEVKPFFFKNNSFINKPIIEYSFLDFGEGICSTLIQDFIAKFPNTETTDNNILKYSFEYYSSRHPLKDYSGSDENVVIPRGLFDLLTIVKRYAGLIIIRSNNGKVFFDFSDRTQKLDGKFFGDNSQFFPGTFITIYLPSFDQELFRFDNSSIKPQIPSIKNKTPQIRYIILSEIFDKLVSFKKSELYNKLIENLITEIENKSDKVFINYVSFKDCNDERLNKVTLFFLLNNYEINVNNNIIIFNPPSKMFINNINEEILNLAIEIKDYNLHPIPLVYNQNDIEWLGIFDPNDKRNLSDFFNDLVIKSMDDFVKPNDLLGNFQYTDGTNNLYSLLSYVDIAETFDSLIIKNLLNRNNCIKKDGLYLCNGNYYQEEFLQLLDLLDNQYDCDLITKMLYRKIDKFDDNIQFIAITSSSHKILLSLVNQGFIAKEKCVFLDSYVTFQKDSNIEKIQEGNIYCLIGDVISGGSLVKRLEEIIIGKKAKLNQLLFLINTIDEDFENSQDFVDENGDRMVYAYKYKINKVRKDKIIDKDKFKNLIRINPYTNLPIIFSEQNTILESILLSNKNFLDYIDDEHITINYTTFNNNLHPYFFDLKKIIALQNEKILKNEKNLISDFIDKINISIDSNLEIFYPKNSDIENIDFDNLKNKVFKDHSIKFYSLDRFSINEGWKFPHTTDKYEKIVKGKSILILDDGSSSGDSILQMINELSHFEPKQITLLCLVGKITSHKREFYSRIKSMKHRTNEQSEILIKIYFGSNWNLPFFDLNGSPYSKEIEWLKEIKKNKYLPQNLKNINNLILETIIPKSNNNHDYKFLLKDKQGKIPKKELFLIRNEIGKVIGYRFYLESFTWFNSFMAKYEQKQREQGSDDRTKDIELLCMCILYEPYVYRRLTSIMPDIREKIEEFVYKTVISDDIKINLDYLYFDWKNNVKDLIHLLFIVFDNESTIKILNVQSLNKTLDFIIQNDRSISTINYLFFKILYHYPLNNEEILQKKYAAHFTNVLSAVIESKSHDEKILKHIKRFKSFVSTLPTNDDFKSKKNEIKEFYRIIKDNVHHRDSITAIYDLLIINLKVLKLDAKYLDQVKTQWNKVNLFMEKFISFENSFPYFFLDDLNNFVGKESIQGIQNEISDIFLNDKDILSSIDIIEERLISFHKNYLRSESSVFYTIFDSTTTNISSNNLRSFFEEKCPELTNNFKFNFKDSSQIDIILDFPKYYFEEFIIDEICKNFRHSEGEIEISIDNIEDEFIMKIINNKNRTVKEGGGNGLLKLENLKLYPEDTIQYEHKDEFEKFIQLFKIKTI